MYHLNRLTRLLSYFSGLLLVIYFVTSAFNVGEFPVLLYIPSLWFCIYGVLLISAKKTIAYYKIFVIANILTVIAGYVLFYTRASQAGFMIIVISISMLAFIITFSRR
jgi:hypothetical protein